MEQSYSSYMSGPRWLGIRQALLDAANMVGVRVVIDDVSRGLIRSTVFFTVTGEPAAVDEFCDVMIEAAQRRGARS